VYVVYKCLLAYERKDFGQEITLNRYIQQYFTIIISCSLNCYIAVRMLSCGSCSINQSIRMNAAINHSNSSFHQLHRANSETMEGDSDNIDIPITSKTPLHILYLDPDRHTVNSDLPLSTTAMLSSGGMRPLKRMASNQSRIHHESDPPRDLLSIHFIWPFLVAQFSLTLMHGSLAAGSKLLRQNACTRSINDGGRSTHAELVA